LLLLLICSIIGFEGAVCFEGRQKDLIKECTKLTSQVLEEDFISLIFQCLVANKIGAEHRYFESVLNLPGASDYPLLQEMPVGVVGIDRARFMEERTNILRGE
jgi:hypothetical protein